MTDKWNHLSDLEKLDVIRNLVWNLRRSLFNYTDTEILKVMGLNMNYEHQFMFMLENELTIQPKR